MTSPITSHVLDTSRGKPAANLGIALAAKSDGGEWVTLISTNTNDDGRALDLLAAGTLEARVYRLTFATGPYFHALGLPVFYELVEIQFHVSDVSEHYHIPLLLSPYGYSTYRGS